MIRRSIAIVTQPRRIRNGQARTASGLSFSFALWHPLYGVLRVQRSRRRRRPNLSKSHRPRGMRWRSPIQVGLTGSAAARFRLGFTIRPMRRSGSRLWCSRPAWDKRATTARIWGVVGRAADTCRSSCSIRAADEAARGGMRPRKELQRAFYDPSNIRNRPLDMMFVIDRLEQMAVENRRWASGST